MKILLFVIPLILAADSYAAVFVLKDGTRVEGTIEGEMDGMKLIKTRYGSLTIDSREIASTETPAIGAKEISSVGLSTVPVVAASTAPAAPVEASTAAVAASTETLPAPPELPAAPAAGPDLTFKTVMPSTASFERIYFEGGVAIATETIDSKGQLLSLAGAIKDGLYREYYDGGNLKTEKTMINGQADGTLKAFYPSGVMQSEAYYLQGKLSGPVRIYHESSRLLFEQNFKDGVPNGWFREFDEGGGVKSEFLYADGHLAEKPQPKKEEKKAAGAESENLLSAKTQSLARGERVSFYLNNKYIAKLHLDRGFNLISKDGKLPDGEVKVYGKSGNLEKEFAFLKNEVVSLKTYGMNGALEAEYAFQDGKAVKK